jgi:hypothetical protein
MQETLDGFKEEPLLVALQIWMPWTTRLKVYTT